MIRKHMNLKVKRFLLAITVGVITLTSLLLLQILDENISIGDLTPFWIFVLFVVFCLCIFLIYISLSVKKTKEYLQKIEKWDSPKVVGLMLILIWAVFGVLYYIRPYIWFFFYAICFPVVIISAVYMRNAYRKQIEKEKGEIENIEENILWKELKKN
jgi:amino acid transporter